jgi:hypothetical protein
MLSEMRRMESDTEPNEDSQSEGFNLDYRTKLLAKYPITAARHFNYRLRKFLSQIIIKKRSAN